MSQTGPGSGATSRRRLWESRGETPSRWAIFCRFLEKNGYFNAIWITFRTFSDPFERTKFLRFESQLTKSLSLLRAKSKTRLKSCILGLNFVTWPGRGNLGTLLSATVLALSHSNKDLLLKIFVLSSKLPVLGIFTTRSPGTLNSTSMISSISISPS